MTSKEIWYVWDKKAIIKGVHEVLLSNGKRHKILGGSDLGRVPTDRDCFTFYTKGETRERVECDNCGGYGLVYGGEIFMLVDGESIPSFITEHDCPDCQGRGYIWKMGEKK